MPRVIKDDAYVLCIDSGLPEQQSTSNFLLTLIILHPTIVSKDWHGIVDSHYLFSSIVKSIGECAS